MTSAKQSPTEAGRDDLRVCNAAVKHVDGFKAHWAARSADAKALDEPPQPRDFVAACREMPENVQRCMHEGYHAKHVKACEAVLTRLDPKQRDRIDALFLEAR